MGAREQFKIPCSFTGPHMLNDEEFFFDRDTKHTITIIGDTAWINRSGGTRVEWSVTEPE